MVRTVKGLDSLMTVAIYIGNNRAQSELAYCIQICDAIITPPAAAAHGWPSDPPQVTTASYTGRNRVFKVEAAFLNYCTSQMYVSCFNKRQNE